MPIPRDPARAARGRDSGRIVGCSTSSQRRVVTPVSFRLAQAGLDDSVARRRGLASCRTPSAGHVACYMRALPVARRDRDCDRRPPGRAAVSAPLRFAQVKISKLRRALAGSSTRAGTLIARARCTALARHHERRAGRATAGAAHEGWRCSFPRATRPPARLTRVSAARRRRGAATSRAPRGPVIRDCACLAVPRSMKAGPLPHDDRRSYRVGRKAGTFTVHFVTRAAGEVAQAVVDDSTGKVTAAWRARRSPGREPADTTDAFREGARSAHINVTPRRSWNRLLRRLLSGAGCSNSAPALVADASIC